MKIKMLTLYAGPLGIVQPWQVVEWPDAEARALIAGGYAQSVAAVQASAIETTSAEPPEAAVTRGRRPRAR